VSVKAIITMIAELPSWMCVMYPVACVCLSVCQGRHNNDTRGVAERPSHVGVKESLLPLECLLNGTLGRTRSVYLCCILEMAAANLVKFLYFIIDAFLHIVSTCRTLVCYLSHAGIADALRRGIR